MGHGGMVALGSLDSAERQPTTSCPCNGMQEPHAHVALLDSSLAWGLPAGTGGNKASNQEPEQPGWRSLGAGEAHIDAALVRHKADGLALA